MFTSGVVRQVQGRELEDGAGIMANVEGNLPANVKKSIQRNLVQGELMAPCRKRLTCLTDAPASALVETGRKESSTASISTQSQKPASLYVGKS